MKRTELIRKTVAVICLLSLLTCLALPVSANSAQQEWSGRDESGVMIVDGDCPLVVEHETLTFDLEDFPTYDLPSQEEIASYSGKVSAEYTFYNPSDMTVTAKLAFPLTETFQTYSHEFTDYQITVDGQAVNAEIRHTLSWYNKEFAVETDLPRLIDDYLSDDFFTSGDLTVIKYTIDMPDFEGGEYWGGARCGIDIDPDFYPNTFFYFPSVSSSHTLNNGTYRLYSERVYPWSTITYYAIGEEPFRLPSFKIYNDWHCNDDEVLAIGKDEVKVGTMRLSDLIFADYDESRGISRMDWYNANLEVLKESKDKGRPFGRISDFTVWSGPQLMVWYCYEITVAPGARITNKVSAPMYPDINTWKSPTKYTYTYLLSPAKTWKSFGDLDIYVNTPHYISNSSLGDFETTEEGYSLHLDGLPKDKNGDYKELTFTLTSEPIPEEYSIVDFFASFFELIGNFFKGIIYFFTNLFN